MVLRSFCFSSIGVCGTRCPSFRLYSCGGWFYARSACIVAVLGCCVPFSSAGITAVFGWLTIFNNKASFRGLFGFAEPFRICSGESRVAGVKTFHLYSEISGVVGYSIILPYMFGFAIIVNVFVGNAFIALGGRVWLRYNSCGVWFYAYIVRVFGVAKNCKYESKTYCCRRDVI